MSPSDASMGVPNDSNIQFVFSESVTTGIGSIKIEPATGYGIGTSFIDITSGLILFHKQMFLMIHLLLILHQILVI